MNLPLLAAKNVSRNKLRTVLTLLGVSVTVLAFVLLRTVVAAWFVSVEAAAKDRLATRHKVSMILPIPKRYVENVRQIPGVEAVTYMQWFGAKNPKLENEFFATFAADPASTLEVYDEISVPQEQKEAWVQNRQGLLAGDVIAKKFGWKVGDKVILSGTIFPGDWQFEVSGIYTATRKSWDRSSVFMHWNYLNDSVKPDQQDQVGWLATRIDDPAKGPAVARAIDQMFDAADTQTLTQSEKEMNNSFIGTMSAILKALDLVSVVILLIMALILGNTIAMGVRERTTEYGVLRALGFAPRHVVGFIMGEAFCLGLLGGAVGLAIALPFVNNVVGTIVENQMGAWFPYFKVQPGTTVAAMVLAVLLALVGSAIPAFQASRLKTIDALRRVG